MTDSQYRTVYRKGQPVTVPAADVRPADYYGTPADDGRTTAELCRDTVTAGNPCPYCLTRAGCVPRCKLQCRRVARPPATTRRHGRTVYR